MNVHLVLGEKKVKERFVRLDVKDFVLLLIGERGCTVQHTHTVHTQTHRAITPE